MVDTAHHSRQVLWAAIRIKHLSNLALVAVYILASKDALRRCDAGDANCIRVRIGAGCRYTRLISSALACRSSPRCDPAATVRMSDVPNGSPVANVLQ